MTLPLLLLLPPLALPLLPLLQPLAMTEFPPGLAVRAKAPREMTIDKVRLLRNIGKGLAAAAVAVARRVHPGPSVRSGGVPAEASVAPKRRWHTPTTRDLGVLPLVHPATMSWKRTVVVLPGLVHRRQLPVPVQGGPR